MTKISIVNWTSSSSFKIQLQLVMIRSLVPSRSLPLFRAVGSVRYNFSHRPISPFAQDESLLKRYDNVLLQAASKDTISATTATVDTENTLLTLQHPSKLVQLNEHILQNPAKEFIIKTKCLDTSVFKMNLVTRMLKNMTINQAINQLSFSKKKPAKWILQRLLSLKSVHATRVYGVQDPNRLEIVQTWCLKGKYYKDIRIHGRGRAGAMRHPSAFSRFKIREIPLGIPMSTKLDGTRDLSEFENIWARLKRNQLRVPLLGKDRVPFHRMPWLKLPYKYLTSDRWVNPKYPSASSWFILSPFQQALHVI